MSVPNDKPFGAHRPLELRSASDRGIAVHSSLALLAEYPMT
jgi:hypothetical protein